MIDRLILGLLLVFSTVAAADAGDKAKERSRKQTLQNAVAEYQASVFQAKREFDRKVKAAGKRLQKALDDDDAAEDKKSSRIDILSAFYQGKKLSLP
jgi:hypothetical protein